MTAFSEIPQSREAEEALLSCCILDPDTIDRCQSAGITDEAFVTPANQVLWECIEIVRERGGDVDEIILAEEMRRKGEFERTGGMAHINAIAGKVDTTISAGSFIEIVSDRWLRRRIIAMARKLTAYATESPSGVEAIAVAADEIQKLETAETRSRSSGLANGPEIAASASERLAAIRERGKGSIGLSTGFMDLDKMTSGWKPGEMAVVAARPGVGKSAIALNFAERVVFSDGLPAVIFSLEMSRSELGLRLLCSRSGVPLDRIRDGVTPGHQAEQIERVRQEIHDSPLVFADSGDQTIADIRATSRRLALRRPLGIVIVDYLQLVSGPKDGKANREQVVSAVTRGLKLMAKELQVPVIALSQLNRQSENDGRRPRLNDLRESGSIEQDADTVLFLHPTKDEGTVRLIVAKQRSGPVGQFPLTWVPHLTRFESYANTQTGD